VGSQHRGRDCRSSINAGFQVSGLSFIQEQRSVCAILPWLALSFRRLGCVWVRLWTAAWIPSWIVTIWHDPDRMEPNWS
jgi:hypothetical protein